MNILILSGGTGSISLTEGLKKLFPASNLTTLINCFDDGKSTGTVREVCNVLGPSDIRKRHIQLYKLQNKRINKNIIEFYENRYDFPIGEEKQFCIDQLDIWGLLNDVFLNAINSFFEKAKNKNISFVDFNISNIMYAELFAQIGYEKTTSMFESILNINDSVIIHSYDNLRLKAKTKNGNIISDEKYIVDYNNSEDPICDIFTEDWITSEIKNASANIKAIDSIKNADLIICSAGTQWSSLIPTYFCKDISLELEKAKAHKILIMNNSEDGDSKGQSNVDIIKHIEKYLNLDDFNILINNNADDNLKKEIKDKKVHYLNLGNINGRHDPILLAKACFKSYYNVLKTDFKNIIFDFDDTLYSRNNIDEYIDESIKNIIKLNELSKKINCLIASGNDYKHIYSKISCILGTHENIHFKIYADGGLVEYRENKVFKETYPKDFVVNNVDDIFNILQELGIKKENILLRGVLNDMCMIVSIKPLDNNYRILLQKYLEQKFKDLNIQNTAKITGRTTIDIINSKYDKYLLFELNKNIDKNETLYIGDEVDNGNDRLIAKQCKKYIQVKSVFETNLILELLND